jgi:hypothetical protein
MSAQAPVRPLPVAAVAVGIAAWVFVPLVGRLSVLEVAGLVLAPPCLLSFAAVKLGRRVTQAAIAWLAGVALSAVVLRPTLLPVLLQVATIVFLVAGAALVRYVLRDGDARTRAALVAAFGFGQIVGAVVSPPAAISMGIWKFAVGQAVTVLALAGLDRAKALGDRLAPAVLVLLAGLHLVLGSRGLALFTLITLAGVLVAPARRGDRRRLSRAQLATLAVGSLVGGLLLQSAYINLAGSGRLGTNEQLKLSLQTGDYGLLVGARKDAVFLVAAIVESPIVGSGPTAPASIGVKTAAANWLTRHGYGLENYDYLTLVLPDMLYLHSELLGAWVTAGILAVPFWVLALVLLWRATLRAVAARRRAESFLLVIGVWHVFFSPIGDITRVHLAVMLGLAVSVLSRPSDSADGSALAVAGGAPGAFGADGALGAPGADGAEALDQQHAEPGGDRHLTGRAADGAAQGRAQAGAGQPGHDAGR